MKWAVVEEWKMKGDLIWNTKESQEDKYIYWAFNPCLQEEGTKEKRWLGTDGLNKEVQGRKLWYA